MSRLRYQPTNQYSLFLLDRRLVIIICQNDEVLVHLNQCSSDVISKKSDLVMDLLVVFEHDLAYEAHTLLMV